jgi:hypothetical protein
MRVNTQIVFIVGGLLCARLHFLLDRMHRIKSLIPVSKFFRINARSLSYTIAAWNERKQLLDFVSQLNPLYSY